MMRRNGFAGVLWSLGPVVAVGAQASCAHRRGEVSIAVSDVEFDRIAQTLDEHDVFTSDRVLLLGESTHGTLEFRVAFARVVLRMAEVVHELTVGLEMTPGLGLALNEAIGGCGNLGQGGALQLDALSPAEAQLVDRARGYNEKEGGCIRIVGVDAPEQSHALYWLRRFGSLCLAARWNGRPSALVDQLESTLDDAPGASTEPILEQLRAWTPADGSHCTEYRWWLLQASHLGDEIPTDWSNIRAWFDVDVRDEIMAKNTRFWASEGPVSLLVHAMHAAKAPIPHLRTPGALEPAGAILHDELGDRVHSLALLHGTGEVAVGGCLYGRRRGMRLVSPPRRPSLERDLFATTTAESTSALSTDALCSTHECGWLRVFGYCIPLGFRDPRRAYDPIPVRQAFDWVVFFPRTSADRHTRGKPR